MHPDKSIVATGQIGKDPYICVWDTRTMQTVSILKQGHTHGISAVNFDALGNVGFKKIQYKVLKFSPMSMFFIFSSFPKHLVKQNVYISE